MIKIFGSLDELKKELLEINPNINVDLILKIDFPFLQSEEGFMTINIPSYNGENKYNFIFANKEKTLVYSPAKLDNLEIKFKKILQKKYGESTLISFLVLKSILKNYSQQFQSIRERMNELDLDPVLDSIEETGRELRKLTDRMEGLLQIIIEFKEQEVEEFDTALVSFDYELLNTETRYWLERCRSHVYRISSLRAKSEIKANRELNDTMKKLTVIMTFLTIVSIVVNVPGTIGAIFGIPALSNAYFEAHMAGLVITLVLTTILSVLLGYVYWRSLKLK